MIFKLSQILGIIVELNMATRTTVSFFSKKTFGQLEKRMNWHLENLADLPFPSLPKLKKSGRHFLLLNCALVY
jgi:hypothetical protein